MADKTDSEEIIYTECKLAPGVFLVTLPPSFWDRLREMQARHRLYNQIEEEKRNEEEKRSKRSKS